MSSSIQQESSSNFPRSKVHKADKGEKQTRRSWSPKEETVLLASLKELVANGWKSDNGFRGGYLKCLEDSLAKEFSGTDLKGHPHISSKLQSWKKNYGSLLLMLTRSGVGFNTHGTHHIDCTDDQWDQIAKCDRNAKTMRHKSWPMFEDWKLVFGIDRATGESAEDITDAVNNMMQEEKIVEEDGKECDDYDKSLEDMSVDRNGENSTGHSQKGGPVNKKCGKGKKRKVNDTVQIMANLIVSITNSTNERLDKVINRIGYEYDLDEAKKDVYALLKDIPGLSLHDKFVVTDIFTDKKDRLITFKGLPDEDKPEYIQYLLKSKP